MEHLLDPQVPDGLVLNPAALAVEKSEGVDDNDIHLGGEIPKIEIKEEDEDLELVGEIKKEVIEPLGDVEPLPKRRSIKPKKYEDTWNLEPELDLPEDLPLKKRSKKKKKNADKDKKKKSKKRETDPAIDNSEEIKVEPKFEIDLDQLADSAVPEVTKTSKCPICKDAEMTESELREHYKQQHPGKRLRFSRLFCEPIHCCEVCGKQFKTSSILRDHMQTHNSYFFCPIDNNSTKKLVDHIIHLGIHSETSTFQCLMCDFNTPEIVKIKEHVNNHEECLKYWCESCKKSFPILSHFQEHDNFHTGLKPFDCEFCGKCFMYSRYLHAHKVAMHKDEFNCVNINQCPICHKEYRHRNSLKLHMNYHTGDFAVCELCGKTLCSKEKLKFHLRIHSGYKPYSCQYCGKSFTKKPILVEHIRVHTGEKPYFCDYCTKCFSQRSSLVIHMRGHTGEKPYTCEFCSKAYAAKAMLTVHLKHCKNLFEVSQLGF